MDTTQKMQKNYKLKPKNAGKWTTNAGNLGKAWILRLSPSIFSKNLQGKLGFQGVFSLPKCSLAILLWMIPNGSAHLFLSRVLCSNRVRVAFFCYSEKGFSLQRASSALSFLHLISVLTTVAKKSLATARVVFATARFTFAAAATPCLFSSVCIQIGISHLFFVHFHMFCNLHAKTIN